MTFKTWDFRGVFKEDFEGDLEGDLKGNLEGDLEGDLEKNLEGDLEGDSKGDFKQDMEGDLLSSSGQVRSRSGLVQVWSGPGLVQFTAQIWFFWAWLWSRTTCSF